jgi:hypothetical protein
MVSDMNNLYVIGKDNPYPLVDNVRPIDYRYDLAGFDDSLALDLDDPDGKKIVGHRCHQRYQLKEVTFALIRSIANGPLNILDKSMGGIACAVFDAKPAKLGKIDNISMGGLMFQHVDNKTQLTSEFVLDILLADCRFYLAAIPFQIITDVVIPEDVPGEPIEMRRVRLQFQTLSAYQQARLKGFIRNHGAQIDDISNKE